MSIKQDIIRYLTPRVYMWKQSTIIDFSSRLKIVFLLGDEVIQDIKEYIRMKHVGANKIFVTKHFKDMNNNQRWKLLMEKMVESQALVHAIWHYLLECVFGQKGDHSILKQQMVDKCIQYGVKSIDGSPYNKSRPIKQKNDIVKQLMLEFTHGPVPTPKVRQDVKSAKHQPTKIDKEPSNIKKPDTSPANHDRTISSETENTQSHSAHERRIIQVQRKELKKGVGGIRHLEPADHKFSSEEDITDESSDSRSTSKSECYTDYSGEPHCLHCIEREKTEVGLKDEIKTQAEKLRNYEDMVSSVSTTLTNLKEAVEQTKKERSQSNDVRILSEKVDNELRELTNRMGQIEGNFSNINNTQEVERLLDIIAELKSERNQIEAEKEELALSFAKAQLEMKDRDRYHEDTVKTIYNTHKTDVEEINKNHESTVKHMNKHHEGVIQKIYSDHKDEISGMYNKHEKTVNEMVQKMEQLCQTRTESKKPSSKHQSNELQNEAAEQSFPDGYCYGRPDIPVKHRMAKVTQMSPRDCMYDYSTPDLTNTPYASNKGTKPKTHLRPKSASQTSIDEIQIPCSRPQSSNPYGIKREAAALPNIPLSLAKSRRGEIHLKHGHVHVEQMPIDRQDSNELIQPISSKLRHAKRH